jgi:hypothetical protein
MMQWLVVRGQVHFFFCIAIAYIRVRMICFICIIACVNENVSVISVVTNSTSYNILSILWMIYMGHRELHPGYINMISCLSTPSGMAFVPYFSTTFLLINAL